MAANKCVSQDVIVAKFTDVELEVFCKFHMGTYRTVFESPEPLPEKNDVEEHVRNEITFTNKFKDALLRVANKNEMLSEVRSFINKCFKDIRLRHKYDMGENRLGKTSPVPKEVTKVAGSSIDEPPVIVLYTRSNISNTDEKGLCDDANVSNKGPLNPLKTDTHLRKCNDPRIWLTLPLNAVRRERLDILKLCVETGIDISIFRDEYGSSLLHEALSRGTEEEMIDTLLQHIDVNILSDSNEPPMKALLCNGNLSVRRKLELTSKLLFYGASFQYESTTDGNAMHNFVDSLRGIQEESMLDDWRKLLDRLLSAGVDINGKDCFQNTPLHLAIINIPPHGYNNVCDADSVDETFKSICNRRTEIVEYLLQKGADPDKKDNYGRTSLHIAAISLNIECVEIVLRYGACVNSVNNLGMTPIYSLCAQGTWSDESDINDILIPTIRLLVKAGCDVNKQAMDLTSVLHFAAAKRSHTVCKLLLQSGTNVETRDNLERTPLHMSVRNPDTSVARLLLQYGANCNSRDTHGDSPLHCACLFGNTTVANILLENKAEISAQGDLGIQPIHFAAENGNLEMMKLLVCHGADINVRDKFGASPLHYASAEGNPDTIQFLIDNKTNKINSDDMGRTSLDLARLMGSFKATILLADHESEIQFGNMPEGLFPNRPPIMMSDMDDYFNTIINQLHSIGHNSVDIGKAILSTPGLGRVELGKGENLQIFQIVQHFVKMVLVRVGELDPLFKGTLLNAGSTFEGVKVGYPDEYDFLVHLDSFSSVVANIEQSEATGFSKILLKSPVPKGYEKYCIRSGDYLNASAILRHFGQLLYIAKCDTLREHIEHLYTGSSFLCDSGSFMNKFPFPLSKLLNFVVSWRGSKFKFLDISIDLNPVIFTSEWPLEAIHRCSLAPQLKNMGMYLIPKYRFELVSFPPKLISVNSDLWRYSFAHAEAAIIQSLSSTARDCYMLCKALRMEPLCCCIDTEELDACLPDDDDDDDERLDGDDDDDDDDDGTVEGLKNDGDDFGGKPYWENFETIDKSVTFDNGGIAEDNYLACDEDECTDEITAEKLIPSYYLKSIFLKELELLYKQNKAVTDKDLGSIPRKVYDCLLKAIEEEHLSTLFIPTQNIYHAPNQYDNQQAAAKLRQEFCKNIVKLLEKLDFKSE